MTEKPKTNQLKPTDAPKKETTTMANNTTPPGLVTQADLDEGLELLREDSRRLKEDTRMSLKERRMLEARVAVMEKKLPILQKRANEITACVDTVSTYLNNYKEKHTLEEYAKKAKEVVGEYKGNFLLHPGEPCPVNKNTPLSSVSKSPEEQLASAEMHPAVKLAQEPKGAPLDIAIKAVREATRTSGVRAAA